MGGIAKTAGVKFRLVIGHLARQLLDRYDVWRMKRHLPPVLLQLASLLQAGLSMRQCLQYISALRLSTLQRNYVNDLRDAVNEGRLLGTVWQDRIPSLLRMLMRAGESTGSLPTSFTSWCSHVESRRQWLISVFRICAYPMFLVVFVTCLIVFVTTRLLPSFTNVYTELELNGGPRSIVLVQHVLRWIPLVLVAAAGVASACVLAGLTLRARRPGAWRRVRRWIPGHSAILMARTSVFSGTLAMLLEAGVPVSDSLEVMAIHAPRWMRDQLFRTRNNILSGQSLGQSFAGEWHEALQVSLSWAEQTGDLSGALRQTERLLTDGLKRWMDQRIRWLEPALVMATGILIGGTVWAVLTPMYDLVTNVSHQALR